jgi:hypothetical protein
VTGGAVIIDNQNCAVGLVKHSTLDSDEDCGKAALLLHKSTKHEIRNRLEPLGTFEFGADFGVRILNFPAPFLRAN